MCDYFPNWALSFSGPGKNDKGSLIMCDYFPSWLLSFSGPRFVLNPIRMFEGSFGGATLYQNPHYVSPNMVSAACCPSLCEISLHHAIALAAHTWLLGQGPAAACCPSVCEISLHHAIALSAHTWLLGQRPAAEAPA